MGTNTFQKIAERSNLTASEKLNLIVAALPPETAAEAEERRIRSDAEYKRNFYSEDALQTLSAFGGMLLAWKREAKTAMGENNPEYQALEADLQPVIEKVKSFHADLFSEETEKALKPLTEIWAKYTGWNLGDDQQVRTFRKQPFDREIISDFWRGVAPGL